MEILGNQLPVAVLRHLYKAVVVVEKAGLIAIGQNPQHVRKAALKAALHVLFGNVVAALGHPVGNAPQALLHRVQADVIQADGVAPFLGPADGAFCPRAGQGGLLGEADALLQALVDFADSGFPALHRAAQLGRQLVHVDKQPQVGALGLQGPGQAGLAAAVHPADDGVQFHVSLPSATVLSLELLHIPVGHAGLHALFCQVVAHVLGQGHGPVMPAGAAHGDDQLALALLGVQGQ